MTSTDRAAIRTGQPLPWWSEVSTASLGLLAPQARDGDVLPARSAPDSPAMLLAPVHLFNTSLPKERPLTTRLCFLLSNCPCSL